MRLIVYELGWTGHVNPAPRFASTSRVCYCFPVPSSASWRPGGGARSRLGLSFTNEPPGQAQVVWMNSSWC